MSEPILDIHQIDSEKDKTLTLNNMFKNILNNQDLIDQARATGKNIDLVLASYAVDPTTEINTVKKIALTKEGQISVHKQYEQSYEGSTIHDQELYHYDRASNKIITGEGKELSKNYDLFFSKTDPDAIEDFTKKFNNLVGRNYNIADAA